MKIEDRASEAMGYLVIKFLLFSGVLIRRFFLYSTAVIIGGDWMTDGRLVTTIDIVPFAQILGTGTFFILTPASFIQPGWHSRLSRRAYSSVFALGFHCSTSNIRQDMLTSCKYDLYYYQFVCFAGMPPRWFGGWYSLGAWNFSLFISKTLFSSLGSCVVITNVLGCKQSATRPFYRRNNVWGHSSQNPVFCKLLWHM